MELKTHLACSRFAYWALLQGRVSLPGAYYASLSARVLSQWCTRQVCVCNIIVRYRFRNLFQSWNEVTVLVPSLALPLKFLTKLFYFSPQDCCCHDGSILDHSTLFQISLGSLMAWEIRPPGTVWPNFCFSVVLALAWFFNRLCWVLYSQERSSRCTKLFWPWRRLWLIWWG